MADIYVIHGPGLLDLLGSLIQAFSTLCAAVVIGIAGALITSHYTRERDRQDKESQWRQHAIELAKLDLTRKTFSPTPRPHPLRPSILDFLANYRDLKELDYRTPKDLYLLIEDQRISTPPATKTTRPGRKSRSAA